MSALPRRRASAAIAPAALLLVVLLSGCSTSEIDWPGPSGATGGDQGGSAAPSPTVTGAPGSALALLATLPVKGRAPKTGYDRVGDFGQAWLDVDHNGCDTRNDILGRDLTRIVRQGTCRVLRGDRLDPYTGKVIHFVRGNATSTLVQIDHVVPLSNAWQTGAQAIGMSAREHLANDPLNLLAVDGATNEQKSDSDAASWLPPRRSFWCSYVARQISVKAKYRLWVTTAERDAMRRVLATCPTQPGYR
ncbi:HNH endonuclease family protein [Galbitalea soli]|uniref:HNH endonuclease family protein n=1 Tax=Galbitalea soli TaxID=1268042 RepID=UPI0017EECD76|nr:hypothetical protein [Galbitalea soli]